MYQVFNVLTGEAMPVIADNPYELAGPLAERRIEQKRDEAGNLVYLSTTEQVVDERTEIVTAETTAAGIYETVIDYDENCEQAGSHEAFKANPPVMVNAGPVYEWRPIVQTDAELLADAKTKKLSEMSSRLAALDLFLPRALEDFWAAEGYDMTKLPQVQQDRLAEKAALRAAYAAVLAAGTVAAVEAVEV